MRNLYAGQEAIVRTGHGTTDWFQIGKGVRQGCILSPCLFNLNAEYIMRKAGLEETQAGIKIARRNINQALSFRAQFWKTKVDIFSKSFGKNQDEYENNQRPDSLIFRVKVFCILKV